jgi:hypothetical protein
MMAAAVLPAEAVYVISAENGIREALVQKLINRRSRKWNR